MFSSLTTWLNNLKLTITQWLGVTGAAVIGILVLLLKIKSDQLHKARIQLLRSNYDAALAQHVQRTQAAKEKYLQAEQDYKDAQQSR